MTEFSIGDTVKITGEPMNGNTGKIEVFDEERGKYLVRVNDLAQHYYSGDELEPSKS
ncbi:hypothetical protein [Brevibacterium marinum]|uniref:Transcription antitermination factor NusG n=1 Tax=Brevibacterium marinum TaxID=418643 RepID=A0A846RY63_9MICO|nr:hypothetical protein [Brevibacterium marinum]NJC56375.1 transcription antitermination factor NusG [Brevibacterium marinum]